MKTATFLLAAFFAAGTVSGAAADPDALSGESLIVQTIPFPPDSLCWGSDPWETIEKRDENDRSWRNFLSSFGVTWPEGSYVYDVPAIEAIVIRNTQANLDKIWDRHNQIYLWLRTFRIRASLWLVEPKTALELGLDEGSGELSPEEWAALRARLVAQDGAEFLSCPTVQTKNMTEASVKGNVECMYPTEFDVVDGTEGAFAVEPDDFQMREVGEELTVLPMAHKFDSRINLTFVITAVREPSWHDWSDSLRLLQPENANPKRALSMKSPDFPCASITSDMDVLPGVVYRVGGTPLVEPGRGRRLFFAFLTVEVTNPKPTVSLNLPTPKFSENNEGQTP